MAKYLKFLYVMTLFISLILVAKSAGTFIECKTDADCPKSRVDGVAWKCTNYGCQLFLVMPWIV
uniref:Nodule-specific cysteine-rich peptide L61 n=1 Tax=Lens culinaris TaxID=3864 RepID=A0A7T8IG93_LENCU|nr:nodule-specific cysteine-rich peptide L61 [Lens culinaris]